MDLLKYIHSLVPVVERRELLQSVENLRKELTEYTLPMSEQLTTAFSGHKFASPINRQLHQSMRVYIQMGTKNPVDVIHEALSNLNGYLIQLDERIKRAFSPQVVSYSLTFERTNLLQVVDMITFYVKYARRLILELTAQEVRTIGKATPSTWPKIYHAFLSDCMRPFSSLTGTFLSKPDVFKAKLSNLSTVEITEENLELAKTALGRLKTDPFNTSSETEGFYAHTRRWINPILSYRRYRAEMEAKRYFAAREEKTVLELRLQEYRELLENKGPNPKLQKLITHTENRVDSLQHEITETEEQNRYDD